MTDGDRRPAPLALGIRIAGAALLFAILVVDFALVFSRAAGLDDDNTYFYLTGSLLTASAAQHREIRAVDATIARLPQERGPWKDYEVRVANRLNYLLPTSFYALAQAGVAAVQGEPTEESYPRYVARSAQLGFCASFGFAALLVLLALLRSRDRLWWSAALIGLSAVGTLDLLGFQKSHLIMIDSEHLDLGAAALGYLRLMVDPSDGFSIFGYAPRCNLALLMVGVASLRWNGERALAWGLFCIAGLCNLYYLPSLGGILVLSDLAGARFSPLSRWIAPYPERTIGRRMLLDQAAFFMTILGTLPVIVAFAMLDLDWPTYFTGILHQRVVAGWEPLLVLGAAYALLAALFARRSASGAPAPWLVAAASIALTVPTLVRLRDSDSSMRRLLDGAQHREAHQQPISLHMDYGDQATLFYAQAKSIRFERDFMTALVPRPEPEPASALDALSAAGTSERVKR